MTTLRCFVISSYLAIGKLRSRVSPRLGRTAVKLRRNCGVRLGEADLRGGVERLVSLFLAINFLSNDFS